MKWLDITIEEIHCQTGVIVVAVICDKKFGFVDEELSINYHGTLSQFLSLVFNHGN